MAVLSPGLQEPETSAVEETIYQSPDDQVLICCGKEGVLVEISVDLLAAAAELLE